MAKTCYPEKKNTVGTSHTLLILNDDIDEKAYEWVWLKMDAVLLLREIFFSKKKGSPGMRMNGLLI